MVDHKENKNVNVDTIELNEDANHLDESKSDEVEQMYSMEKDQMTKGGNLGDDGDDNMIQLVQLMGLHKWNKGKSTECQK